MSPSDSPVSNGYPTSGDSAVGGGSPTSGDSAASGESPASGESAIRGDSPVGGDLPVRADLPVGGVRRFAAAGTATGWFETLYAEAAAGRAAVPWDVPEASAHLRAFALPPGEGRRALVVGCGPGRDAEHVAAAGYAVTAFDISATAIALAKSRHPGSAVSYVVADLLAAPASWRAGFDLVLESNNVQALPATLRPAAIAAVSSFVAPGGTLLVLAAAAVGQPGEGPPWPLTREEITSFAAGDVQTVSIERSETPSGILTARWRALFTRP